MIQAKSLQKVPAYQQARLDDSELGVKGESLRIKSPQNQSNFIEPVLQSMSTKSQNNSRYVLVGSTSSRYQHRHRQHHHMPNKVSQSHNGPIALHTGK